MRGCELVGAKDASWSWSTTNGALVNILVADELVRTAADLRRVLATLPERPNGEVESAGQAFYDAIVKIMSSALQELIRTRVRLGALIELLEERGIDLGAD